MLVKVLKYSLCLHTRNITNYDMLIRSTQENPRFDIDVNLINKPQLFLILRETLNLN